MEEEEVMCPTMSGLIIRTILGDKSEMWGTYVVRLLEQSKFKMPEIQKYAYYGTRYLRKQNHYNQVFFFFLFVVTKI